MSEEKCNHWYKKEVDNEFHCRDCNVIFVVSPYWGGRISIGKMESTYEIDTKNLDIRNLIKDQLNTPIDIVTIIVSEKSSWDRKYLVHFMVGKAYMVADLTASQNDHYVATDRFYVEPVVVEETAPEDAEVTQ